jgi:hypothetical protein
LHRAVLVAMIYGMGLHKHGQISCMLDINLATDATMWDYSGASSEVQAIIEEGIIAFNSSNDGKITDNYGIYDSVGGGNNNPANFTNSLSKYYANSFVEIISETSFNESAFLLTEKTLNSIYGCNFPILMCSAGTVKFLRNMGMDMFDDVVDHSYDDIQEPYKRILAALTLNQRLLTDSEYTKELWKANALRFVKNIEFARSVMPEFYTKRATDKFTNAFSSLGYAL